MAPVNEKSSCTLELVFTDENGAPVTPSGGSYRIDDVTSGQQIIGTTAFTPTSSTYTLDIPFSANTLIDASKASEDRRVTVTWQYGGTKQGTAEYRYLVKNLVGVQ